MTKDEKARIQQSLDNEERRSRVASDSILAFAGLLKRTPTMRDVKELADMFGRALLDEARKRGYENDI